MGTFRETLVEGEEGALYLGTERARVYYNLSPEDKERYNMLLEGFELTKEDYESQLYDDFEHFRQNKGETIHEYYVRFTKLINDMRNIKMTMPRMQLNSKFVNNMLPEWGRFVTAVKLNKGLKESNYDQLYAYLKQDEAHANENKTMLERFTHTVDPLASMSNVSPQQYFLQSSTTLPSTYAPPVAHQPHFADNTQLDSGLSPTDNLIENLTNTLALLTQSYKIYPPQTNKQFRTSSNTRIQATVQDGKIKCYNCNGIGHTAKNCTQPKRPQNLEYFKDKMLLMKDQENGVVLDEEQLLFFAGCQDNVVDDDVDELPIQDLALNVNNVFQADECDAFDSDVDEAPTALTMFMENLSSLDPVYDKAGLSYDLDILSEVIQIVLWNLDSGCSKHMMGDLSRLKNFVKKFIETFRFGNDHFGAITGYGDYVIGDSVISRVYYVEGLGHNIFLSDNFVILILKLHSGSIHVMFEIPITHAKEEPRDEESFDPIPKTPEDTDDEGNGEENLGINVGREEGHDEEEEEDELYRDVNINQGRGIQMTQEVEDSHVTLTPVNPDGQQQSSSVSSQFVTSMLNLTLDAGMESIFETTSQIDVQTPTSRMNEAVKVAIQIQSDRLQDEAQAENDEFLKTIDENMQKIIKEQVKEQVKTSYAIAADLSKMELKKILTEKIKGNKSIQRSNEQRNLYKALVDAYESDKIILDTYGDTVTLKRCRDDDADKDEEPSAGSDQGSKRRREGKEPESTSAPKEKATRSAGRSPLRWKSPHIQSLKQKPPTPDRDWNKTLSATHGSIHPWISELAKQSDSRSSFNDTLVDFSNFLINRFKVDTLTLKLLAGPTYELLKGSCKSLVELEYHLEEVYKATIDQLDWVNLEGASSRKYTTSITKTKAADYEHIKWIEDLMPRTMWIQELIGYDKHALWGVSHWGRKRQQFYGFAVNRESAHDVYSKRRIIAVTELKIIEWHNYKHLDWITVRRDDDKLYKFKEGDFKRLRIQDIEDMLLLLVQGKLTNLTVEERFAFNVSLRMFTRSIVIQRRVEDLQLGVERYQKKLNLTKPDTYRFDLKRKEAYIAYSNPRGFIYQNKDKQNRLTRIDELHKFSDGTLTDVCTALDDRLKGIQMQYLPQSIWRKSDKHRAAAMIQAIDKRLKTRRIMRSLERFVGGRLYEGDFRMLQRTI
uniref:Integrase, catalytic region, zinc finger, CCHC-type, peptidase aspartic, catalytic n=1 Tax=Tanacetum cinerariifolium TaxID=118510 RepID=A0A6L2KYB7_TANCI|nr:integrase, catalytic region, zinc finger, CCHC-type, peptidase aspartic, catalytic [Tanacetum cinerariifolium]